MVSFGKNTTFLVSSFSNTIHLAGPPVIRTLVPAPPSNRFYVVTLTWSGGIQGSRLIIGGVSFQLGNPDPTFPTNIFPLAGTLGPLYLGPGDSIQIDTITDSSASGQLFEADSF